MRSRIWVTVTFFILLSWLTAQAATVLLRDRIGDNYNDAAFLTTMVKHYQEAQLMARHVAEESHNTRILDMARAVIREQEADIVTMRRMLAVMGETVPPGDGLYLALQHPKRDTAEASFVAGMLAHHKQGVILAAGALEQSRNPAILDMARNMIREQADQMLVYQSWLASRN